MVATDIYDCPWESSAPQKCSRGKCQQLLSDIGGVEIVVDDVLVHGRTQKEHDERLLKIPERARKLNLKLNAEKSKISRNEVEYVGHKITPLGLKPSDGRVIAIPKI